MKDTIAIIINKSISLLCRLLKPILHKDGSVTPGYYANKYSNNIIDRLKYPKIIIGVTGSSGKGSTTRIIAKILKNNNYKVIWNKNGSNLYNAAVTLILNNTNPFTKKINGDVLLLELDESYIKSVFHKINPTHLVITNITRDQVARNGEPELIYNKILNSIDPSTTLIINANDPLTIRFSLDTNNKIVKYGILKYKTDYKKPLSDTLDAAYCPICHKKYKYDYYHYGNIGIFKCPNCKYGTFPLDYHANDINLANKFMTINNHIVKLDYPAMFTCYATLAAYALANTIGIKDEDIMSSLNNNQEDINSNNTFKIGRRRIEMIDSKPENALSYEQTIDYILEQKGNLSIIIGFDNVSRRYSLNDISWLYDINFEKLNNPFVDKIFCIGRFRYDIAYRLELAGLKDKIIIIDDYKKNLSNQVTHKSKGNIYTVIFVDMMDDVKNALIEVNK